ncbi:MAG: hypothetical protein ABII12_06105, partial [Planctomycetota bacterium]
MKRFSRTLACAAACIAGSILLTAPSARADNITVDEWSVSVSVYAGFPDLAGAAFSTVVNPFVDQHSVTLPSSTQTSASAQYDFAWGEQFGQFMIQAAHQAEDAGAGSLIRASSPGHIFFTSNTDIAFSVEADYTYDLPAYGMTAYVWILFADFETHEHYFAAEEWEDTFLGGPKQGTFTMGGEAFIPAGREILFGYRMKV